MWSAALMALALCMTSARAASPALTILYSFTDKDGDGAYPYAGVIIGKGGALYGTTLVSAGFGSGTVFELTPPSAGGAWTETILYTFIGEGDGAYPYAAPAIGKSGGLFGTTDAGGTSLSGTAYELTPPSGGAGGAWTETVLHSFSNTGGDGTGPYAGLIPGKGGVFYGTTASGGAYSGGTVFELTPGSGGAWTETVLYSFTGQNGDGRYPNASLTAGANGSLYGTTESGGTSNAGTVFELTPPAAGQGGAWTETVLYSFTGGNDGGKPLAPLALGTGGALFGTTSIGGTAVNGVVFELTPPDVGGAWTETVLYSFTGQKGDGANPYAGVALGGNRSLYGTTFGGGIENQGTVFELTPPASGGAWKETVLHRFTGNHGDGSNPYAGLVISDGTLYGTTTVGGSAGFGAVFQLTP
jgi:uncharacterized repeat protein (TIGR03803 family)